MSKVTAKEKKQFKEYIKELFETKKEKVVVFNDIKLIIDNKMSSSKYALKDDVQLNSSYINIIKELRKKFRNDNQFKKYIVDKNTYKGINKAVKMEEGRILTYNQEIICIYLYNRKVESENNEESCTAIFKSYQEKFPYVNDEYLEKLIKKRKIKDCPLIK